MPLCTRSAIATDEKRAWAFDLEWQGRTEQQQLGKYRPWFSQCKYRPLFVAETMFQVAVISLLVA